jgi:hypothetical protein
MRLARVSRRVACAFDSFIGVACSGDAGLAVLPFASGDLMLAQVYAAKDCELEAPEPRGWNLAGHVGVFE